MKYFFGVVSMMVAQVSFGAPIFCKGDGWELMVNSSQETAELTREGEPVQFGSMVCGWLETHAGAAFLNCRTAEHVADAGFSSVIKEDPATGNLTGKLIQNTFVGKVELTKFKCVGDQ